MVSNLAMKAFLSAAVVFALLSHWAQGSTAAQGAKLSVADIIGCYELRSIEWPPGVSTQPQRLYTPPRFFTLTATRTSPSYRRIQSRDPKDPERLAHGEWMLGKDGELIAMFPHSGNERLFLTVSQRASGARFSGSAIVNMDTGSLPGQGTGVFDRVACWEN